MSIEVKTNIVKGNFGMRFVAFILDLFFASCITAACYFAAARPLCLLTPLYSDTNEKRVAINQESYIFNDDGSYKTFDTYEEYAATYPLYFTSFLPSHDINTYDNYWFNVFMLGQDDVKDKYKESELSSRDSTLLSHSSYFTWDVTFDDLCVPSEKMYKDYANKVLSEEGEAKLIDHFYSTSTKSVAYYAGTDFFAEDFVSTIYSPYYLITITIPLVSSVFVGLMFALFLFPMIFKDGATLGKKACGLGVLGEDGYRCKKWKFLLRTVVPTLALCSVSLLSIPIALFVGTPLLIVSGCVACFTKSKRAFHDYWAMTQVISVKESTWFVSKEEEEEYQKEVEATPSYFGEDLLDKQASNFDQLEQEDIDDIKKEKERSDEEKE